MIWKGYTDLLPDLRDFQWSSAHSMERWILRSGPTQPHLIHFKTRKAVRNSKAKKLVSLSIKGDSQTKNRECQIYVLVQNSISNSRWQMAHCVDSESTVCGRHEEMTSKEYLDKFKAMFEKVFRHESGGQFGLVNIKNRRWIISCLFDVTAAIVLYLVTSLEKNHSQIINLINKKCLYRIFYFPDR